MVRMSRQDIIPAGVKFETSLCDCVCSKKEAGIDAGVEKRLAEKTSSLLERIEEHTDKLENALSEGSAQNEAEKAAIHQYRMHMKMINDPYIHGVLARIIKDEEYHIMLLRTFL